MQRTMKILKQASQFKRWMPIIKLFTKSKENKNYYRDEKKTMKKMREEMKASMYEANVSVLC